MNDTTGPDPIDVRVGLNIRMRRKALALSQTKLADHLGLTFQQVQKYERGTNRVSASMLWRICQYLEFSLDQAFSGAEAAPAKASGMGDHMGEIIDMVRCFPALHLLTRLSPRARGGLATLLGDILTQDGQAADVV